MKNRIIKHSMLFTSICKSGGYAMKCCNKSVLLLGSVLMLFAATTATAQQKVTVHGGADLVSSYIWRGSYNAGASVQPSLSMEVAGFKLGAWGSTDLGGNGKKEVDLSVSYTWKGLTVGVTDYWWAGEGAFNYFRYTEGSTAHFFEGNISYQLPIEKFPLIISWNTMFAGADQGDYSTYIELCYPFMAGPVSMKAIAGAAPWYSPAFLPSENRGFSVCNVAIAAEKAIYCSDKFSIPLFSQLSFNPATEDVYLVFGMSLKF